jgi:hypothetical protein
VGLEKNFEPLPKPAVASTGVLQENGTRASRLLQSKVEECLFVHDRSPGRRWGLYP